MRTPPSIAYSGLAIVIDRPSRFDTERLLTGPAGAYIEESIGISPDAIDIRDASCFDDLLPNTKYIALLGRQAAARYKLQDTPPGYIKFIQDIPTIIGFNPQECCDHRMIEDYGDTEDENSTEVENKDTTVTRRSNYYFWTAWYLNKLLAYRTYKNNSVKLNPVYYPNMDDVEKDLIINAPNNGDLYLDIETSRPHRGITCIGLSIDYIWPKVYVVPIYDYRNQRILHNIPRFYKIITRLFNTHQIVAHNAMFDLLILHAFYKFPLPQRVYDTMLANHRMFPEIEKSLGHVISQWLYTDYHKGDMIEPYSRAQEMQLFEYNAKDVYSLKLIKDEQDNYAFHHPGLTESIQQANDSLIPYLENSLTGLRLDTNELAKTGRKLLKTSQQLQRICSLMLGYKFNPASPKQCKELFHDTLHYDVIAKSEKGNSILGRKQLYQLMLKYNNPIIPVIIAYREAAKDSSMLESGLWSSL